MDSPIDPHALIARCINGDDVAKAEFILAYGERIRRTVARKLATMSAHRPVRQDVEDIANDILLRLLDDDCAALRQIRDRPRIDAWLHVTVQRYTVDYVRKWSRQLSLQGLVVREAPMEYGAAPDTHAMDQELSSALDALLATLTASQQLVLVLYYRNDMSYNEIAGITGLNINTIATQLRRARQQLRAGAENTPLEDDHHVPNR